MTTHQSTCPPVAARYFESFGDVDIRTYSGHPVIKSIFRPTCGWKRYGFRKRVSISAIRVLKAQGVTHVSLSAGRHEVDFSTAELLRREVL